MMRLSMGYPSARGEAEMLAQHERGDKTAELEPVASAADVLMAQDAAERVLASDALRRYVVGLLQATRDDRASSSAPRRAPA
jgi:MoxR-like ATPase